MIKPLNSARADRPDKGMAALTVVMIIFFVMALVAAYTNRNLVFEQRISTNTYKAARALEAAEAAVDWTLSMLNGGALTDNCTAPTAAALTANPGAYPDFRRRYLSTPVAATVDEGRYTMLWDAGANLQMYPACIIGADAGMNCICPKLTNPNPTMVRPADGIGSAFNVNLTLPLSTGVGNPGVLNITAQGCASIGTGSTSCYTQVNTAQLFTVVDAKSGVDMTVGLVRALPLGAQAPGHPQLATLTAGGTVSSTGGILRVVNSDLGLTVHAGGLIPPPSATAVYVGAAGSRSPLVSANDTALYNLAHPSPADDSWFLSFFGMLPALYKVQPALIAVPCAGGECTSADLTPILARYPRHPIWVQGNLTIDDAAPLGDMSGADPAARSPVMLVIDGDLRVTVATPITGFVHAKNIAWNNAGATVRGALVTPGDFTYSTNATLIYDLDVINTIRLYYGSFVRVPGSWKSITF